MAKIAIHFALAFSLLIGASAQQTSSPTTTAQPSSQDGQSDKVPLSSSERTLSLGAEGRIRSEDWNNIIDFNHVNNDVREQIRYRIRGWMGLPITNQVEFNVGLNDEFYQFIQPVRNLSYNEVVFETFSLQVKKLYLPGLSMQVGRENLVRGEGFILFDGTPGDGSRTGYFNAADISYKFKKSNLELIGILNPQQDRFLPRINDQHRYLIEWDEQAIGLYYTNQNHPKSDIQAYYFYKKEIHDYRPSFDPQYQSDRHVSTLGGRIVHQMDRGFSFTGEAAVQWGVQHPNISIRAGGGYGYLRKDFTARWKPYVLGGYWILSGDNPNTPNKIEGWDPIFSRWPKWGDLYLYATVPEKGVGYATNNRFSQLEAGFSPYNFLHLRTTWYHQDAFFPFPGTSKIFGTGTERGNLLQARGDFTINSHFSGHVVYEGFLPGSFYSHQSSGFFLRGEVLYCYTGKIALGHHN